LKQFGANIFVQVKAEDLEEAKDIIGKIVNADFGEELNEKVISMSFYDVVLDDYDIWEIDDP